MPSRDVERVLKAIAHNIALARAGAGNVYRHEYEDVLPSILWTTVKNHLNALEDAVRAEGA